jgi:hypothetical protein
LLGIGKAHVLLSIPCRETHLGAREFHNYAFAMPLLSVLKS